MIGKHESTAKEFVLSKWVNINNVSPNGLKRLERSKPGWHDENIMKSTLEKAASKRQTHLKHSTSDEKSVNYRVTNRK